jgi:hypothetical protein
MPDEEVVEEAPVVEAAPVEDFPPIVMQTAAEVISGHWGRGNVRKARLIEAGYDPKQIQEAVDKIFNQ